MSNIYVSNVYLGDAPTSENNAYGALAWHGGRQDCSGLGGCATDGTQTYDGDYSWTAKSGTTWVYLYSQWKITVLSGSLGNGHVDVYMKCKAGSSTEGVAFTRPPVLDPDLTDNTTASQWAANKEDWLPGAGGHTYQTGYFEIRVGPGDAPSGNINASYEIQKLRWEVGVGGYTEIWNVNNAGTGDNQIGLSCVQLGARSDNGIYTSNTRLNG